MDILLIITFVEGTEYSMSNEEYLNAIHLPKDVPEDLIESILEILNRIPRGWGRWISLDSGWYPLIIDLNKKLAELDPDYEAHQVKEKFGSLRYYFGLKERPKAPCCVEWEAENPYPRTSWRSDDPKSEEYSRDYELWANAMDEHYENEEHRIAYVAQAPLRQIRHETFDKMQELVDEAERLSMVTCELCSLPGSMHIRGSWWKTLCGNCALNEGYKKANE